MVKIDTETSPTLVSGVFTKTFGEFEKIISAKAVVDTPAAAASGQLLVVTTSVSGVTVTVTVLKVALTEATDGDRVFAVATTSDVSGLIFTITVDGE